MRKLFILTISVIIVGVAGYTAFRGYRNWKQQHLVALARKFLEKSDTRSAMLSLQSALDANPGNIEACRLAADVFQAQRSPEALRLRQRIVDLDPKSVDDRVTLTETAGTFRAFDVASNALAGFDPQFKATARYNNLAGSIAATEGHVDESIGDFSQAVRLEPSNVKYQFNLALMVLQATNSPNHAEARATLQRLASTAPDSAVRSQALRGLIEDARSNKQDASALGFASELVRQPGAVFEDQLAYIDLLQATKNPQLNSVVASLQQRAVTNVADIGQLGMWEQTHGMAKEGLGWLRTLPPEIQTNQPVAQLIAESYMITGNWVELQKTLDRENWGNTDFVRHAFLSRAYRNQQLPESAASEWQRTVAMAAGQPTPERMLISMAARWGWENETEELLWKFVKEYPAELWASRDLTQILFTKGQTRSILNLFKQQAQDRPADLMLKSNLAITALLLNATDLKPDEMAREVYEKDPANPRFAVTYAFSLVLQKKNADALKVIEKINPTDLEDPSVSGYYGLILEANGEKAKAKKYLKLAEKGSHLPEEKKLFADARARA